MPLYSDGWSVIGAGTYRVDIRADYETALGTTPEYLGTVDGAWTTCSSELAFRVDQQGALLLSTILLATAPRAVAVARAIDAGLTPRAATSSRYTAAVPAGASGTLEIGQQVQDPDGLLWSIVDIDGTTTGTQAVTAGDPVIVECDTTGPVALSAVTPSTLTMVTPVPGIDELEFTPPGTFQAGRDEESTPALKVRIVEGGPGSDPVGVKQAIRELDWVVAVDADFSTPGYVTIAVNPAPSGADQIAELASTIYGVIAGGVTTQGASSTTIVDGVDTVTIRWDVGSTQAVAVVYALTLDGTVSAADAIAAADAALSAEFAQLGPGEPIRYLRAFASLDLNGVTGATLTLNGGTSDVTPSSAADVLIPSPITGSAS